MAIFRIISMYLSFAAVSIAAPRLYNFSPSPAAALGILSIISPMAGTPAGGIFRVN
jgi:hypothetical protein